MSEAQVVIQITFLLLSATWAIVGLISGIVLAINSSKLELKKYNSPLSFHPLFLFVLAFLYWPVILPWYIDIRSLRKKGELVLKSDQKSPIPHLWIRTACFLVACLLPWIWYFGYWAVMPAVIVPFLNDPISRIFLLLALLVWQPIGLLLTLHSKNFSDWLTSCLLTGGPAVFLFMVGVPVFNLQSLSKAANAQELVELATTIHKNIIYFGLAWAIVAPVILVLCVLSFPGMWIAVARKLAKKGAGKETATPQTT